MILDLLKNNFPQYKINDSSNRNIGQIEILVKYKKSQKFALVVLILLYI